MIVVTPRGACASTEEVLEFCNNKRLKFAYQHPFFLSWVTHKAIIPSMLPCGQSQMVREFLHNRGKPQRGFTHLYHRHMHWHNLVLQCLKLEIKIKLKKY